MNYVMVYQKNDCVHQIIGVQKILCKIVISADRLPCGIIFNGSNQLCLR